MLFHKLAGARQGFRVAKEVKRWTKEDLTTETADVTKRLIYSSRQWLGELRRGYVGILCPKAFEEHPTLGEMVG